jgi:bifunctional UDP-N-acetylglucosamine pyrophosphorylase/glucosamine-1-phosphate N-acetyltransferase
MGKDLMSSAGAVAAVVLAAGKGARMKSALPKVLHPLAGRPMLLHLLETVAALAPARTVLVASPENRAALATAASGCAVAMQSPQLGTAHAVQSAREALKGFDGDVLVLYADTPLVTIETLRRLLAARRGAGNPAAAVLGFRPEDSAEYGRLVLDPEGRLERIVEFKDADAATRAVRLCNSGVMALDGATMWSLLDRVSDDNAKREFYLTDVVELARRAGRSCVAVEGDPLEVLGVNSRAQLAEAEAVLQRRLRQRAMDEGATLLDPATVWLSWDTRLGRDVTVGPSVFFGPGVAVSDSVEIRAFSHLEGCSVAPGAVVGPFARLRPGAEIGEEAHIGNFVEVKQSRVEAGAKVNHLTYVGDARVGARANVGAGTITCNYDGFEKHHTDIGAGAFIGSNTSLVAPVKVGDGAIVGAGSVITRDVPADALAVTRAEQRKVDGFAADYRAKRQAAKAARRKRA